MTRNEGVGLGLAALGHVALFALLSLAWSRAVKPPAVSKPIEVSLVDAVALDQHAPRAPTPPSRSTAPDVAPPEDAPPPPKAVEAAPDPAPPKPKADAVPPPRPVPTPRPAPSKPIAERIDKPEKAKAATKAAAPPTRAIAANKAAGASPKASKAKATGSLLDDDFRRGLTQAPSRNKASEAAPGATMNAAAAADIGSAIRRQVQPCADRQVNPGPGAARIVVTIRLSLNRDGSLAGRPTISDDHGGVDDENRRYVDTIDRNAIATFTGCAPLRGLPPELYDVPRGWKTFILRYKLPG